MKEKQEKETLLSKNKKSAAGAVQETAKVSAILLIFLFYTDCVALNYLRYIYSIYVCIGSGKAAEVEWPVGHWL